VQATAVGEAAATASETAAAEAAEALRGMAEDATEPRPVRRAAFNALHLLLRYGSSHSYTIHRKERSVVAGAVCV